jgi:hypothetical protein
VPKRLRFLSPAVAGRGRSAICRQGLLPTDVPEFEETAMKKTWKRPTMCQVAAGMEISRYLPAEIAPRK